ncbi:MAG: PKD domain-containing protein [Vicinamibacterales bacterium]
MAAGANLQTALNAAQPGDTILLAEGAEFVGNFVLPVKAGTDWITVRTSAPDSVLPAAGWRIGPAHAALLARVRSPNSISAIRTAPGAHHWKLQYLDLPANQNGYGDIIRIGDGSSAQSTIESVPHHIVLDHLYVHGSPLYGQKRGIALNAADVTITDSYVSECKAVGQDTQALGGWNGPGPYVIENNYFEATGENVLFGGADPSIPGLVADGITFRRNYLSRPMSWREPIIETPQALTAAVLDGGSLEPGVYAYRIVARRSVGQGVMGRSTASAEITATVETSGSAVHLTWQAVEGATEYRVYGRTSGTQATYWRVSKAAFVDSGLSGSSEKVPTSAGTVWSVKNLFELKSARNVVIEDNVMENHWKESQPGYAIVFTPRNSGGSCTWCVIEHVRFENNLVRNVSAGINLTGYDALTRPTQQTNDIVFRNNVFEGMRKSLDGNAWFLLIGSSPRDVTIEHNTIDADGSALVYAYGGTSTDPQEIEGFRMVANAARHGSYGFNGSFFSYGDAILENYYPGGVLTGNYFAGGPASRYPAGNLFAGRFEDQFVDVVNGNYALHQDSALRGAAPDGSDIGADYGLVFERINGVVEGKRPGDFVAPVAPSASFSSTCTYLECVFQDTSAAGSSALVGRTWTLGDGTSSDAADATHVYTAGGTYTVTLTVVDASGLSDSATDIVTVEPPNVPPTADFSPACVDLVCIFTDRSSDADGTLASWQWTIAGSPQATTSSTTATFAAPGTYDVALTVTDDDGAVSTVSIPVQVTALVHAALADGTTTSWTSRTNPSIHYWSANVIVNVHGADERAVAGATVTAAWSGALTKTVTCVTATTGQCTFKSGTLSMLRSWVTLTIVNVSAPSATYDPTNNHRLDGTGTASSVTMTKP